MEPVSLSAPSIEKIVTRLNEVGNKLLEAALKIETKKKMIELAKSEVRRLELEVENDRAFLAIQVSKYYSDSEIEDAVKICLKK